MTKRYVIRYNDGTYAGFNTRFNRVFGVRDKKTTLNEARIFGNVANAKSSKAWITAAGKWGSSEVVEVKLTIPETQNTLVLVDLNVEIVDADAIYDRIAKAWPCGMTREEARRLVLGNKDVKFSNSEDSVSIRWNSIGSPAPKA